MQYEGLQSNGHTTMLKSIAEKPFTIPPHFPHNTTEPYASHAHHSRATLPTAAQHGYQKQIDAVNLRFALGIDAHHQYPTLIHEADFHFDHRPYQREHLTRVPPPLDQSGEREEDNHLLHEIGAQFS